MLPPNYLLMYRTVTVTVSTKNAYPNLHSPFIFGPHGRK
jgi:hypothetical protein